MVHQYKYKAVDINKRKFNGIFIADSEEDLALRLAKQGLYLVSAKLYTGDTPSAFFTIGFGGVKTSELTNFCRQFSIMINSGISILSSLEILKEQAFSAYFRKLLEIICDDVRSGKMLSDAFDKHKNVFPAFFRSMIRIGEQSGKISQIFESLAAYYEKESSLKRKIRSALAYPTMLFFMMIGIVVLMLLFVVPTFRESLAALDLEVTGITAFVYDVSDFLSLYWLHMLGAFALIFLVICAVSRTKKGKFAIDWIKLHTPFIGKINVNIITSRFSRCFGLLLSGGMDITDALDSVAIVFTNKDAEKRFKLAADDVRNGIGLAIAFGNYKLFPPIMLQIVAIGERTASLDMILSNSCSFFDDLVESSLNSLVSKIQPIMLLILGSVIGFLFIAVYSPMISIMQGLV